ncbi:bactofilin family protein [Breznakiella homolactica]|uniref:Polymer-forming cytoskeletal protein n=1 Tax=Breznakiella homolactica TaxID=2798577 RepID=A0A7T7XP61_9SPIR|nr:polymer-forming cytoskeletal protein [Breznakiella homolactica]QQO09882.1 polymer-forming cytoskeletal protein [Breznakiella homolactica]
MARVNHTELIINTIIGPGTSVNGDITAPGFVRVDGSLRGDLKAAGRVVVGENARMKSDISGTNVTIGGVVQGNILASERITILSTGLVLGDIITRRIQADDGCLIHGRVVVCQDEAQWNATVSSYRDARSVYSAISGFASQSE